MWQFIFGSDAAFAILEEKARRGCVRFRDQQMPPGASAAQATVAFEIDSTTGVVRLLVDRHIKYVGPSGDVQSWFLSGERCFDSFKELKSWLATTMWRAFGTPLLALHEECSADDCGAEGRPTLEVGDREGEGSGRPLKQRRGGNDLPS